MANKMTKTKQDYKNYEIIIDPTGNLTTTFTAYVIFRSKLDVYVPLELFYLFSVLE